MLVYKARHQRVANQPDEPRQIILLGIFEAEERLVPERMEHAEQQPDRRRLDRLSLSQAG